MTDIKIEGKLGGHAAEALALHAGPMFARLGSTRMVIAVLKSATRQDVAADEDKKQSVNLRVQSLEVANPDQEDAVRRCLEALHLHRTAYGTLTEDLDVDLSASVIEATGGELNAIEAARLKVAIDRWTEHLRRVTTQSKITQTQMRNEIETAVKGLRAAVEGTERLL